MYINGQLAGQWAYGYTGFYVEADKFLKYGEENEIRVEAFNADQPNSRWYSGAGIYRPVWLHVLPRAHVLLEGGVKIKTIDYMQPRFSVDVITNAGGQLKIEILDGSKVIAGEEVTTDGEISIEFACPRQNCGAPKALTFTPAV